MPRITTAATDAAAGDHVRRLLPRSAAIVAACHDGSAAGFVLESAHCLAIRHRRQWDAEQVSRAENASAEEVAAAKRLIDDLNGQRVGVVEDLDTMVAREVHGPVEAPLHTETFGSVVDRLAIAWVRADALIHGDATRERARLALRQLAELADAYDDLVRDVASGRRRLPTWRALKSYRSDS